jgi:hypothetical protein
MLDEQSDIRSLIRDELDRNNRYFEFAQQQISKDRDFYKHLYTFAGAFIGLMVVVAGIFQYTSVTQMRTDMKASVDAELDRDKAEIAALRAQATTAEVEAQATVTRELGNVRSEVQKRVDTEFQTENITAMVASAAKERTAKELTGIIRSETESQVSKGIKSEQPFIRTTVENQTKAAVNALQPTIKDSVNAATQQQVATSVAPIESQMASYGGMIRVGNLTTLARGDDRQAFDYLVQIELGTKPESSNVDLKRLAGTTASAIIAEKESGIQLGRQFKEKQTPESMRKLMSSPNPLAGC